MRQEAQLKLGYFPCPLEAVDMIAEKITADPQAVLVDPCAGDGAAIAALADRLGVDHCQIVASELERNRSEALAKRLPESSIAKCTDFQSAIFNRCQASLLWLNPPFDNEVGKSDRCELTFLSRATSMLKSNGVLVLIMPEYRIPEVRMMIHNYYYDAQKFEFPERVRKFREIAIVALKRDRPLGTMKSDYSVLAYPVPGAVYHADKGELFEIVKQAYTDEDLLDLLKVDLLKLQGATRGQGHTVRPPLQLGQGHVALLLAAGHLNGRVSKPGESPHVVRGTSRKIEVTKEEVIDKKDKTVVTQEKIELVIRLAYQSGELHDLSNS